MTAMFNLYANNYTANFNWAAQQAGNSSCADMFKNTFKSMHAVLCAVCTFFALYAISIIAGAVLSVLISLAIINIIGLIIILADNRIFKAKELCVPG